jgi:SAM-dependent methyltransferase
LLEQEKNRYLTHINGIDQPGYVKFLNRAIEPSLNFLTKEMIGLDFGCGYAPTLSKILKSHDIKCEDYDPIFFKTNLKNSYDFIFSTEVFEHFFYPNKEIKMLNALLKNGGYLIVMTERWTSLSKFNDWYYTKDPTHVSFYHNQTFRFICQQFSFDVKFDDGNRVIILKKIEK